MFSLFYSNADAVTTPASNPEPEKPQSQNYEDLFPSLPMAAAPAQSGTGNAAPSPWGKKPMSLTSSTVTQVFHIPVEERKDQVSGNFGEGSMGNSHKIIMSGKNLKLSDRK